MEYGVTEAVFLHNLKVKQTLATAQYTRSAYTV